MNNKFFSMKAIAFLKSAAPLLAIFVFAVGVLNFGSYDPYNELTTFTPELAAAQAGVPELAVPTLGAPTLSVPTVTVPVVTTPAVVIPVLEAPVLETPTLPVPTPAVPTLSVPTLETPTLTTPSLTPPAVTVPTLTVPSITVPGLTIPTLTVPTLGSTSTPNLTTTIKTCTLFASTGTVTSGSSVTLTWNTQGYSRVTINGEVMNGASGSRTYTNIQANTTYTILAENADGKSPCRQSVTVLCVPPVVLPPTCTLTPASATINTGAAVDLTWTTTNAASANLSSFGAVALSGTRSTGALASSTNYTLSVVGNNGDTVQCHATITVKPKDVVKYCELTLQKTVSSSTANPGDELTYTIKIKNIGSADCTGGGVKIVDVHDDNLTYLSETHSANLTAGYEGTPLYDAATKTLYWNGNTLTPGEEGTIVWKGKVKDNLACDTTTIIKNTAKATAKELSNFTVWVYSNTVETSVTKVCQVPVVNCDAFAVSPTTITRGASAVLNWATTNATRVAIDNAIGEVSATGTLSITPLATTTYTLTAFGVNNQKDVCQATIVVEEPPVVTVPKCDAFTATPTSLPAGGGTVALAWSTQNAGTVSISPTIGVVAANGSTTVTLATTTTYTLTVSATSGTNKDTCAVTIPVLPPTPTPITCAANVSLSASPTLISRGDGATISWATTGGITGVSFDNGITSTGLSGSATVSPNSATTYTLTATDGTTTVSCPVTVDVRTGGGGGGGSNAPRCELSVSKKSIRSGENVVLTWDSTRATTLFIEDQNLDDVIVTTEGKFGDEKDELFDGRMTVSPKEDTRYLLTVKRGSTTRTCAVEVEVDKNVVVTQIRDQQPLVSGIALTQVPYTGFEAGPILTLLFYVLLMAWALYMAYLLVIRRDAFGGLALASAKVVSPTPEAVRPDVFVTKVQAPVMPVSTLPTNLPTGTPAIGYANHVEDEVVAVSTNLHDIDGVAMTEIENFAHSKRVLLSSDAIRHFVATTTNEAERQLALEQVITAAKAQFPAEDGWIVINEKRMQELCLTCAANQVRSNTAPFVPAVLPEGAGSLAEAIVTGNVVAAYEMIGHRPMFALADASADLDAVYRIRRGGEAVASELLMKATATMTEVQLLQMIEALTSALDGTYTDEAAAVKMAIMKAIKVVA